MTGSLVATGELARPIVTDRCTRTYPEYDLMRRCRALVNLLFVLSMAVAAQSVPVVAQDKKDGVQPDGLKNLRHPDATVRYRTAALLAKQGTLGSGTAKPHRDPADLATGAQGQEPRGSRSRLRGHRYAGRQGEGGCAGADYRAQGPEAAGRDGGRQRPGRYRAECGGSGTGASATGG